MSSFSTECRRCARLAQYLAQVRRERSDYHARPVESFGDPDAGLLVVGLAPGMHGANRTGRPFTGDHAGILLYETLHAYGFANRPTSTSAADDLQLIDCRITNAVRCVPPQNKPTTAEIKECNAWLQEELDSVKPRVLIALGAIAHDAVLRARGLRLSTYPFKHGARHRLDGVSLIDSYHCSRYNTQTRRLTSAMFRDVFAKARHEIDA
ncbi:MAG: uracil-DNA glycosylase [Gammaproteobacteria bacterium]|nr:uracil-DNA glycosylase [Gammaproteobacteria bacterium]